MSILLMGVLMFNWYGYQLLSSYWQQRAGHRLEAALDRQDYEESNLISIKIPILDLAYSNSSLDFERATGQITIANLSYKYVRSRLLNDSLELLCIPDLEALQISSAANDYFRQVNDLGQQKDRSQQPHPTSSHQKGFQKEYAPGALHYRLYGPVADIRGVIFGLTASALPLRFLPTTEQPPDAPTVRDYLLI